MEKLDSPYIVKHYGSQTGLIERQDGTKIKEVRLFMDYFSKGDLSQFINNRKEKNKKISEEEIWLKLEQISKGVSYLHD
jgi:serine/threonine protein kinase